MSRNPKHSPPGSPQLSRRTPQQQYSTNSSESLYAIQTPLPPLPPPTTTHNINGNVATHTNISLSSMDGAPTEVSPAPSKTASSSSSASCKNGASSRCPVVSSSCGSVSSVVSQKFSKNMPCGEELLKELKAPPLPPRKASSNNNNNSSNEINGLNHSSSENITVLCEFDVPRTTAPPIPKHQTPPPITSRPSIDQSNQQMLMTPQPQPPPPPNHHTINDQDVEQVIVGPAETISGIIDTRPIGHRKPINSGNDQQLTNNLYHLKNSTPSPTMHVRHASLPVNNAPGGRSIGENNPKPLLKPPIDLPPEVIRQSSRNVERPNSTPQSTSSTGTDSFLYENMTMSSNSSSSPPPVTTNTTMSTTTTTVIQTKNNSDGSVSSINTTNTNHLTGKDCDNVPYENINLDYITRLMNEGYSKEHVITALGKKI